MNRDESTIAGFGDEWTRFDQSELPEEEKSKIFEEYFSIFDWSSVGEESIGFDLGCGSGRWASIVAPRVGHLICVDPSDAIEVAKQNLKVHSNVSFHQSDVDNMPIQDDSMDFGYSLGVLHHIPDTGSALRCCVKKLKIGAPFLVYLYYRFDNRPFWFKTIWRLSDCVRKVISRMPHFLRSWVAQILAVVIYWPLARLSLLGEKCGFDVGNWPLSSYRDRSLYSMRTDSLDRFGTRLEQRFTREEIGRMMEQSGLNQIRFAEKGPAFWCAIGRRVS